MTQPAPAPSRERIEPADVHNLKLLDLVHPRHWINPTPAPRYHLVVVGAGTAGLVAAAGAAGLGARVALVERHLMGGDCLNVGCVPSKALVRAARVWRLAGTEGESFGAPPCFGKGDFAVAMERMRRLRATIAPNDSALRFRDLGIDVFLGDGRFVAPDAIEVDGTRLAFRNAVVATGGRAAIPDAPGLATLQPRTNETIFELTELPRRLAVVGGGPIGCELAQVFARFGSQVTLLEHGPRLLHRDDPDAAAVVATALARDGVRLELGVTVVRASRGGRDKVLHFSRPENGDRHHLAGAATSELNGDRHHLTGEVAVDEILVAAGRRPNIEGLGLEAAGVAVNERGVVVDDFMRSTNPRIFAAGDVAGGPQFTHAADAQARIVIQNAFFAPLPFLRKRASRIVVPWCTYTSPEVAHVGLTAEQATKQGVATDVVTFPLAEVDRAILDGEPEGFVRLHLARGKDRILGATVVAANAGDLVGELCLAVTAGVGLNTIAGVVHPYPTHGEIVKKAADAWRRGKLTPGVKRFFRSWFKLLR